jgi:hypothetical protein
MPTTDELTAAVKELRERIAYRAELDDEYMPETVRVDTVRIVLDALPKQHRQSPPVAWLVHYPSGRTEVTQEQDVVTLAEERGLTIDKLGRI